MLSASLETRLECHFQLLQTIEQEALDHAFDRVYSPAPSVENASVSLGSLDPTSLKASP